MIALHCRSWAGPVRSSLGKRVPQTRMPKWSVNHVIPAIEPDKPPRSRPTSSISEIGHAPQRVLALAGSEHMQQFWDSETDRARELRVFGSPTFVVDRELFWGDDRL